MSDLGKVDEAALLTTAKDTAGTLDLVRSLVVNDAASFELASKLAVQAQTAYKALDKQRTDITRPILEAKRRVDLLFKPALEAAGALKDELKKKIDAYVVSQSVAQVRALEADAASLAAGIMPSAIVPEIPSAKGVSTKIVWDFEVTDPELVPREFCSPDPGKIKNAIWYADTPTPPQPVPGVRFFQRGQTTVRSSQG